MVTNKANKKTKEKGTATEILVMIEMCILLTWMLNLDTKFKIGWFRAHVVPKALHPKTCVFSSPEPKACKLVDCHSHSN